MGRIEKALRNASWGVISRAINVLILFIGRTVFIYVLGEQYLGISSLFTNILSVLSLAELGFAEAITFSLYKPLAENNEKKVSAIMKFFKRVYILIGFIILTIGFLLIPFLNVLVKDVPDIQENIKLIFILYVVNSAMSYFYAYKSTLLEATQEKYITSIVYMFICLIKTVINCIILYATKNFILYLIIEIIATLLYNFIVSYIANKKYPNIFILKSKISKEEKSIILKNVRAMFFYKVSGVFLTSTDNIIINTYVGTVLVGKYSNYTLITNQLYVFILQIFNALTASIGNLAAVETKEKQYTVFKNIFFLTFVIYCFSTSLVWILVNPFISLIWSNNYVLPDITVALIVIIFYIMGNMTIFNSFRITNGLFAKGQYRPIAMVIINIILSIILVKPLGINGVLLATIIARLVTEVWFDPYLIYKYVFNQKLKGYWYLIIKYTLTTLGVCLVSKWITNKIVIENLILALIVKGFVTFVIAGITIYIIYHKTEQFEYFKKLIQNCIKKIITKFKFIK